MLSIEQIADALKDRNLTAVAERVGLSYPTVLKIAHGESANYESVKKLSDYLETG